jgi:hypothetical protein
VKVEEGFTWAGGVVALQVGSAWDYELRSKVAERVSGVKGARII